MKRVESRVSVENVLEVDGAAALTSILVDHRHHLEQEGGGEEKEATIQTKVHDPITHGASASKRDLGRSSRERREILQIFEITKTLMN